MHSNGRTVNEHALKWIWLYYGRCNDVKFIYMYIIVQYTK